MARILLKTTIPQTPNDWNIARFSLLARHLEAEGHQVTARDRVENAAGDDADLTVLADGGWDQLWLFAVDVTGALTKGDCANIRRFLASGGGAMLTRDHQDMGACLTKLGLVGQAHNFNSVNQEADATRHCRDDPFTATLDWPNYHSGANGDFQIVTPGGADDPLLALPGGGTITRLPAHPHEGAVSVPTGAQAYARVVATGVSKVTAKPFNIAVALERHDEDGMTLGPVLAEATFHRFADYNWNPAHGCPSFVGEAPGDGYAQDPGALDELRAYIGNIARWLAA